MKSSERHQLKQDRFVATLQSTYEQIDQNRKQLLTAVAIIIVLVSAAVGYLLWRQHAANRAAALFAEALAVADAPVNAPPAPDAAAAESGEQPASAPPPPAAGSYPSEQARLEAALPKFLQAAEAYPSTTPGLAARYHAAATLVALGRDAEAAQRYQEVINRAGSGLYARVARLGLAEVQVRQGQYEPAINLLNELSTTAKDDLPVDGILMQLGRAYVLAGRKPEAAQAFKRIIDEFPASPYAGDAKRELEGLQAGA